MTVDTLLREARKNLALAMVETNRMDKLHYISLSGHFAQRAFALVNSDLEFEVEIHDVKPRP